MEQVKSYLRNTYDLSSYQVAQIFFLLKTIGSEPKFPGQLYLD